MLYTSTNIMAPMEWDDIEPRPDPSAQVKAERRRSQREQRQQKGFALRRQTVLEVGWLLLQEVGLSGFNMRLLGDRASYTAGALYSYFPGREDVLAALRSKAWDVMGQVAGQTRPTRGARGVQAGVPGWCSDSAPLALQFVQRNLAWWRWLAAREPLCELVLTAPASALQPVTPLPGGDSRPGAGPSANAATGQLVAFTALAPCIELMLAAHVDRDATHKLHARTVTMGLGCLLWRHSEPLGSLENAWMAAIEPWARPMLLATPQEAGGDSEREASRQPDLFAEAAVSLLSPG